MIISKELRDLIVGVLKSVTSNNVNYAMTIKGIVASLEELKDETEVKPTLEEIKTDLSDQEVK